MASRKPITDIDLLYQFSATLKQTSSLLAAVVAVGQLARSKRIPHAIVVPQVVYTVAKRLGVSVEQILGGSRQTAIVEARHIAIWIIRESGLSFPDVAKSMNLDNHSSVMYACSRVDGDAELRLVATRIMAEVERDRADLAATVDASLSLPKIAACG